MGRGFGKLGAEEAVSVFSHDAPDAMAAGESSRETTSAPVPARALTENSDEGRRLEFENACFIPEKRGGHEKPRGIAARFSEETKGR
jgi:hypothetical protein